MPTTHADTQSEGDETDMSVSAASTPSVQDLAAGLGVVDVTEAQDPLLAQVPLHPGGVHRFTYPEVGRVVGPYYAVGGALVRVSHDVVVLLGNPTSALTPAASEEALRQLAAALGASVEDVAPSKRLGG